MTTDKLDKKLTGLLVLVEKTLHITILFIVLYLCVFEILSMYRNASISVASVMLLFIYLELIQMIQIYFSSGKIPVRYPLYISMFSIARIISFEDITGLDALYYSGAILMVGLALLALAGRRYIRELKLI
jgi:protein PsiE